MGFGASDELGAAATPWSSAELSARGVAFAAIWATGADTSIDGVVRVQALRRDAASGRWEVLDVLANPFAGRAPDSTAARVVLEAGTTLDELAGAPEPREAFARLTAFVGERVLVVAESEASRAWLRHFAASDFDLKDVLGLGELASLLAPARAAGVGAPPKSARDVQHGLSELIGRFLALDARAIELGCAGWCASWRSLRDSDPETARRLELALQLVEMPELWRDETGIALGLRDRALSGNFRCDPEDAGEQAAVLVDELQPRCAQVGAEWRLHDTVPVASEAPTPFADADLALVDDVFEARLPALFERSGGAARSYRRGQHEVARHVAATLGSRKMLLVHAPTGTGKTLAYLVPALLWSLRHNVRVGVSTYTRALQEQAIDSELPRALQALELAGVDAKPRVTLLKGRANYLCWRALRLQVPSPSDSGEAWLAWTGLALFALMDDEGDLDRFPMRAAIAATPAKHLREVETLVRAVRCAPVCCKTREDREACAAEIARVRAERSHLVVTNHAFLLAVQSFVKHVVFDECEHLHDQAGGAWSHTATLREMREQLVRLRQPGRPNSRAPLDRLERVLMPNSPGFALLQSCETAVYATLGALDALEVAIANFRTWRDAQKRLREPRDEHSLLREYVAASSDEAQECCTGARELIEARRDLALAANELDVTLSELTAGLDVLHIPGAARVRRALELGRTDLLEWLETIEAWIPLTDGVPNMRRDTFHDVEEDSRGDVLLAARVLLPNEFLGRHYYPQLDSAVFISATTYLRNGFESAAGYLGLDRAAQPAEDETREPREVTTFRAEDPFDYSRVVVCVPNDAPSITASRETFGAYVREFISQLGERTRGRMLVLFTNSDEARRIGQELSGFFRARGIPLWFQNMPGVRKEELGALFRERVDSILLGVDTFWYGADFPGETLEYLVIVKLPYGVPDRYHHAQCAALGQPEQRRRIYLPRALGKFRQGFGRLMRRESDRGCVFVLDSRVLVGANKLFLGELPLDSELGRSPDAEWPSNGARLVVDETQRCVEAALAHMGLDPSAPPRDIEPVRDVRGDTSFVREVVPQPPPERPRAVNELLDIAPDDVPF
jgi:Rad3-related DNA helicase